MATTTTLCQNGAALAKAMVKSRKKPHVIAQILGWYGALALMGGFLLISMKLLTADTYAYQLLNLTGSLSLLALGLDRHVRQTVVVNIFWATIATVALVNLIFR